MFFIDSIKLSAMIIETESVINLEKSLNEEGPFDEFVIIFFKDYLMNEFEIKIKDSLGE